jgi:hypothetical protein
MSHPVRRTDTRSLARMCSDDAREKDGDRQVSYSVGYTNGVQAALSYLLKLQRKDKPLRFAIDNFKNWSVECKSWSRGTKRTRRLDPPPHP